MGNKVTKSEHSVRFGPIRCFEGEAQPFAPFWTWNVRNAVEGEPAPEPELEFYGYISEYAWWEDDITPKKFKDDLYNNGKGGPVTIRINSGGGEMIAASVIRSILMDYPGKKTVRIDGLCASAAVAVAMAGDVVRMQDSAYMMIHNPFVSLLWGYLDAAFLTGYAEKLELFKEGLMDTYESRTGLKREWIDEMMDAETWMTAKQAVELGFADEVISNSTPARPPEGALTNYVNVPAALLNIATSQPVEQAPDEETPDGEPAVERDQSERQAESLREEILNFQKRSKAWI